MPNIIYHPSLDLDTKVAMMQEDAAFDVADEEAAIGDTLSDIRERVRSRAVLPRVPKVFLTNDCIFNCAYCTCRESLDCKQRYVMSPQELAELSYRQSMQSKAGIFLTSAIHKSPHYTQELIIRTLEILRNDLGYRGYIHAKVMPGADPALIEKAGTYANRLSVNIEVARSEGYAMIARNKNKRNILTPMGQISTMIRQAKEERSPYAPRFATTQTTQLMAGSTGEDDFTILNLSGALYRKYHLSRVYYTAFTYRHRAAGYDDLPAVETPSWRMGRLYQADRLMQLYGFAAEEIAPPEAPFLSQAHDPKAAWALRHLDIYPVEVNTADFELLLRVPGIGLTYAKRILEARRQCIVTHGVLRTLGVALKRCQHFITCNGYYAGETVDNDVRLAALLSDIPSVEPAAEAICGQ